MIRALLAATLALLFTIAPAAAADPLDLWPADARAPIAAAIDHAPAGAFATFDADNTIWQYDLEESLLPYLENAGMLSVATLDPALKPIPLLPGESLYGYYQRLCAIDDKLCFPWIAQAFSGIPLATLKREIDTMIASAKPIPVRYLKDGKPIADTVMPPRIMPAQRQLFAYLHAHGIRVYVVSASAEELVRMVVSDPRYGLGIAPRDVIGVTELLRDPVDGSITTARGQIAAGHFLDATYPAARHARMVLTPTLWSPLTWYEGKVAAIAAYIDPVRRPVLAAGDSASDWPMLFHAGGVRIWVDRKGTATPALAKERLRRAAIEASAGLTPPLGADRGWVVAPQDVLAR
ncbi:MAG TPA: HAD family hydrolase [Sphingomonas sp.]